LDYQLDRLDDDACNEKLDNALIINTI